MFSSGTWESPSVSSLNPPQTKKVDPSVHSIHDPCRHPGVCVAARSTGVVTRPPSARRCCQRDEHSVFASGCVAGGAHMHAGCACRVRPSPARAHGQRQPMTYQFISTVAFGMRGGLMRPPRIRPSTFPCGNVRARSHSQYPPARAHSRVAAACSRLSPWVLCRAGQMSRGCTLILIISVCT